MWSQVIGPFSTQTSCQPKEHVEIVYVIMIITKQKHFYRRVAVMRNVMVVREWATESLVGSSTK